MDDATLIDTARQLAVRLQPADLDATLANITSAAVDLLPDVHYSSITILRADRTLATAAPTDDIIVRLDEEQYRLTEGPCYDAASHTDQVVSADLALDERFPAYGAVAASLGVRSQIGVRLFDTPQSNGALNLYSRTVGAFDDDAALSALFAHQAGQAIGYARHVGDLEQAVRSRTVIGQAVGIVMERYDLKDEHAFAFLKRLSSHRNVKLRQVAEEVVSTVPSPPAAD
jgi:GAF domain-containing protein